MTNGSLLDLCLSFPGCWLCVLFALLHLLGSLSTETLDQSKAMASEDPSFLSSLYNQGSYHLPLNFLPVKWALRCPSSFLTPKALLNLCPPQFSWPHPRSANFSRPNPAMSLLHSLHLLLSLLSIVIKHWVGGGKGKGLFSLISPSQSIPEGRSQEL